MHPADRFPTMSENRAATNYSATDVPDAER